MAPCLRNFPLLKSTPQTYSRQQPHRPPEPITTRAGRPYVAGRLPRAWPPTTTGCGGTDRREHATTNTKPDPTLDTLFRFGLLDALRGRVSGASWTSLGTLPTWYRLVRDVHALGWQRLPGWVHTPATNLFNYDITLLLSNLPLDLRME